MAIITFGSATTELNGANGAGRALLYDAAGNAIVYADTDTPTTPRGLLVFGQDHDQVRPIDVSRWGRLEVPNRRILFIDDIEGATLNTQKWTSTATTMTSSQSATNGILLNASAITTINTGIALSSRFQLPRLATGPLHWRKRIRSTLVANQEGMAGLFFQATLSGTATVTGSDSGFFWKWGTDGTVKPAYVFNGVEVSLGSDITGFISSTNYYDYHIVLDDDRAIFQVFNSATGAVISKQIIKLAVTAQRALAVTHLYCYARVRNSGSVPASAGQMFFNEVEVAQIELRDSVPADVRLSETGLTTSYSPTVYTQLTQFANSAAPASATLSNTAAGYTTLGGLWQFAALAGANTDYCLFGFAVPAPYRLKIKGVHVAAWNTGAANAATPATMMLWGLGLNGASANLATGGHIRRLVGQTTIPISAAIGANANDIDVTYSEPLICEPGTTLAIILRVVAGAATVSQVIQGMVDVRGVFE